MRPRTVFAIVAASLAAGGCGASLPGLSTGSLFGGAPKAPAPPQNDSISRAMQVGTTSARAIKCGYNFDPGKLRTQFLAAETAASPADGAKITQIYDTSFSGVSKAVAGEGKDYCSASKTSAIKEALNRHLTGDYTPSPPEPEEVDTGLFGDIGAGGPGRDPSMKHPIDDLH